MKLATFLLAIAATFFSAQASADFYGETCHTGVAPNQHTNCKVGYNNGADYLHAVAYIGKCQQIYPYVQQGSGVPGQVTGQPHYVTAFIQVSCYDGYQSWYPIVNVSWIPHSPPYGPDGWQSYELDGDSFDFGCFAKNVVPKRARMSTPMFARTNHK